ncbi:histidine phosphatase family protein [Nitrincola tibetensis]|uniref:Histidine phosphatase family protein n=1 Tax=Nitrincola tibetensis TaxID=2219697 RepID=A0A364NNC8_9GAMM|nr:histidine phosphatase family protein [Nitrincola tibetensis]RAU18522.1 histidine phosphatase family protein [Nitrincola tibetensis]
MSKPIIKLTEITILRHATAQDRNLPIDDRSRELVEKGFDQLQRVVAFCRRNDLTPSRLLSSPYPRAFQTASYLYQHLLHCPKPQTLESLSLMTPTVNLLDDLMEIDDKAVWLVGHEPDIGLLISSLTHIPVDHLDIKKASLTRLLWDKQQGNAQLLWSLPCALMK